MSDETKRFDKYRLLEPLAKGGMGEVHLASSTNATGIVNFVAIKTVLPELTLSGDSASKFKDEAATGMKLKHPNIVTIFEFGEDLNEQFYVVMEFIRGQTLRSMISRLNAMGMHLPLPLAVHVIKGMASGLNYARRCIDTATGLPLNLVHKDISPANVMIGYEGEIKIIDFGIAKSTDSLNDGVIEGKLSFMSPEHARGGVVDHRSDLYAVGLVAYEMLTGKPMLGPKQRQHISTLEDLKEHCAQAVASLPDAIRPIIGKLLEIDPSLRYQTGHDLVLDLGYMKFDRNDVQPETGLTDLMTGLYADEISSLNRKLVAYSNSREDAGDLELVTMAGAEKTIVNGKDGRPFTDASPLFMPEDGQLFAPKVATKAPVDERGRNRDTATPLHAKITLEPPPPKNPTAGVGLRFATALVLVAIVAVAGSFLHARASKVPYAEYLKTQRQRVLAKIHGGAEAPEVSAAPKITAAPNLTAAPKPAVAATAPAALAAEPAPQSVRDVASGTAPSQPAPQPVVQQINRFVKVVSNPEGADISVNGKPIKKQTPMYIEVAEGEYFRLTLKMKGFVDYEASLRPEEHPLVTADLRALNSK